MTEPAAWLSPRSTRPSGRPAPASTSATSPRRSASSSRRSAAGCGGRRSPASRSGSAWRMQRPAPGDSCCAWPASSTKPTAPMPVTPSIRTRRYRSRRSRCWWRRMTLRRTVVPGELVVAGVGVAAVVGRLDCRVGGGALVPPAPGRARPRRTADGVPLPAVWGGELRPVGRAAPALRVLPPVLGRIEARRRAVITLPADPFPAGPRDLPDLRLKLLERWRPGGAYYRSGELDAEARGETLPSGPRLECDVLARAGLWWVTGEMTQRIPVAPTGLPATTLNDDLVPEPFGLVVFAEPLIGLDAEDGHPVEVHAIVWARIATFPDGRLALITRKSDGALDDEEDIARLDGRKAVAIFVYQWWATAGRHTGGGGTAWIPLGRSEWVWGEDTADVSFEGRSDLDEQKRASMEEDRRWLATLWLLAAQPLVATSERTSPGRP